MKKKLAPMFFLNEACVFALEGIAEESSTAFELTWFCTSQKKNAY